MDRLIWSARLCPYVGTFLPHCCALFWGHIVDLVEFEGVEILAREVRPETDCGWTRTGDKVAVPTRILATVWTAEPLLRLDFTVNVDWAGRGLVRELKILTDSPQAGISITLLRRIPVDTLMRFVMGEATRPVRMRPDISERAFQLVGQSDDFAWVSGPPADAGRGTGTPTDRVVQAAEAYKQAVASGSKAPAEYVSQALKYSRATAARDLRLARKRGLLPESGKSKPTRDAAITGTGQISRMSAEEFNRAAEEMGLQGPGPKGKRLAEWTPDEFAALVERLEARSGTPNHDGAPKSDGTE